MSTIELLTPLEVYERYGIHRSRLHRLVKAGRIKPAFDSGQPGIPRLYAPASIEAYNMTKDPRGRKRKDGK